jgi:hypothetical protein
MAAMRGAGSTAAMVAIVNQLVAFGNYLLREWGVTA